MFLLRFQSSHRSRIFQEKIISKFSPGQVKSILNKRPKHVNQNSRKRVLKSEKKLDYKLSRRKLSICTSGTKEDILTTLLTVFRQNSEGFLFRLHKYLLYWIFFKKIISYCCSGQARCSFDIPAGLFSNFWKFFPQFLKKISKANYFSRKSILKNFLRTRKMQFLQPCKNYFAKVRKFPAHTQKTKTSSQHFQKQFHKLYFWTRGMQIGNLAQNFSPK